MPELNKRQVERAAHGRRFMMCKQPRMAARLRAARSLALDTDKCLIYADKRLIATLGVSDLVIVETDAAILIAHKHETTRLKELHAQVEAYGGVQYL